MEMVRQLQELVRKLQADLDSRLDTMTQAFESRSADDEAEALAAGRIRSGAAERTQDGTEALSELGIHAAESASTFRHTRASRAFV